MAVGDPVLERALVDEGRRAAVVLVLAALWLGAAGCRGPERELTSVKLRLNWLHECEFAGFYVAARHGLFEQRGLAVEILPGGPLADPAQELAGATADFAVLSSLDYESAVRRRQDVVVLAAVYQITPMVFMARRSSGIRRPQDLAGHRVGIKNQNWDTLLSELLVGSGVALDHVVRVPVDADMGPFYRGEVDVWTGYAQAEPVEARLSGQDVTTIFPYEYGFDSYEGLIAARGELVDRRPDLVASFLAGALAGWELALRQPAQAVDAVLAFAPGLEREFQIRSMEALGPLVYTGDAPLGWIDPDRWARMTTSSLRSSASPGPRLDLRFLDQRPQQPAAPAVVR